MRARLSMTLLKYLSMIRAIKNKPPFVPSVLRSKMYEGYAFYYEEKSLVHRIECGTRDERRTIFFLD
jgi:hypothetical protein